MSYMIWQKEFSVGVEVFDADHIILVSLINHLHDAVAAGREAAVVESILAALITYVETHFHREESMMRNAGYPRYDDHKEEHDQFARRIDELRAKAGHDGAEAASRDLLDFLKTWLQEHILKVDMGYKDFFRALSA